MRHTRWLAGMTAAIVLLAMMGGVLGSRFTTAGTASADVVVVPDHPSDNGFADDPPLSGKDAPSSSGGPSGSGETSLGAVAIVVGAVALLGVGVKIFGG